MGVTMPLQDTDGLCADGDKIVKETPPWEGEGAMEKWKLIFISERLSRWMETDDNLWCGPCTEFGVTDIGSKLNVGEILLFLHYGFLRSWAFFLQWFFVSDPFD